jgi:hypothetical protein
MQLLIISILLLATAEAFVFSRRFRNGPSTRQLQSTSGALSDIFDGSTGKRGKGEGKNR